MSQRWPIVGSLLAIHAALLAWSGQCHSPTIDEPAHLAAGMSYWQLGRFDIYSANPPLVKLIAAIPVLAAAESPSWQGIIDDPRQRREWEFGGGLCVASGPRIFQYVTWARWVCIPFSLLGGFVCYRWGTELSGGRAGLTALSLWCFSPGILGHAALITSDVGAAALAILATYAYWKWLKQPNFPHTLVAGVTLGLAQLAKFTCLLLLPTFAVIFGLAQVANWYGAEAPPGAKSRRTLWRLIVIFALAVLMINAGYAFDGSFTRLDQFRFVSDALSGEENSIRAPEERVIGNRWGGHWLGRIPVPLPRPFLMGMEIQKADLESPQPTFAWGQHRASGVWWWYFYALSVKAPLGMWVLALLATSSRHRKAWGETWYDELVLLLPAGALVAVASTNSQFTNYARYLLPAAPFVFVWMSRTAMCLSSGWSVKSAVFVAALSWTVASSLWHFPHSLSYFNELAGGPTNGHRHLRDANLDWGQDLLFLKRWLDRHPGARPVTVAYFGPVLPSVAGIEDSSRARNPDTSSLVTPETLREFYAISSHLLWIPDSQYRHFQKLPLIDRAGYSIWIFQVTNDEIHSVRRESESLETEAGEGK